MNCPVCKTNALVAHNVTPSLVSQKCEQCGGQWISSTEFSKWLEEHRGKPHESTSPITVRLPTTDGGPARICPECGRILARYKVGHSLPFSLDRCGNCGGIWFDRNEWEILQSGDLKDQVHLIFSDLWQHRVREQAQAEHLQALLRDKIGEKDFTEIQRITQWLKQHPHRQELLAYVNASEC